MNKSLKYILALSFTGALLLGIVLVQFAGANKTSEAEQYKEILKNYFGTNQISYDYLATFDLEDTSGIVSRGRLIKSGSDYVDSNEQYYRILSGNTFLNIDLGMKSVFAVDIKKMEQRMGFKREDLNSGIFDVTDSNYAALGNWRVTERKPDATAFVEFKVSGTTAQPISKVEFVFKGNTVDKMKIYFNGTNANQQANVVNNLVVTMDNFKTETVDLEKKISEVVRFEDQRKPVLLNKFKEFQFKQL